MIRAGKHVPHSAVHNQCKVDPARFQEQMKADKIKVIYTILVIYTFRVAHKWFDVKDDLKLLKYDKPKVIIVIEWHI